MSALAYEEAYRFCYDASFCDTIIEVTVGKAAQHFETTVRLYALDMFTGQCTLARADTKEIGQAVWADFKKDLRYYEYWGMKEINTVSGLDGSSLWIYGYQKVLRSGPAHKGMYRWAAENTAMGHLVRKVFDFSDVHVWCADVNFGR